MSVTNVNETPLGSWRLNGNAQDASGNGNHGTVYGATFAAGKVGQAGNFDGVDDYVDLGSPSSMNFTGKPAMTVMAWVKADTLQNYDGIISNSQSGSQTGVRFGLSYFGGKLRVDWGTGTAWVAYYSAANSLNQTGQWYHVAATVSSAGQLRLYVNGEQSGSTYALTGDLASSTASWKVGRNYNSANYSWDGLIDEVKVYDRTLTADEIQSVAYAEVPPAAYYQFEGNAQDGSGNGNHGTVYGTTFAAGKVGQAGNFDGADDYIDLGSPPSLNFTGKPAMTVMAWVKADTLQTYDGIISNSQSGSQTGVRFSLGYSAGKLRVDWGTGTAYSTYYSAANSLNQTGQWCHVAVTVSSAGQLKLYVNGEQSGSTYTVAGNLASSSASWKIGRDYNLAKYSWDGLIDEVKLYDRTLTADEIQAAAS